MNFLTAGTKGRAYLYLTLTTCLWGSIYVVSKAIMDDIPPITLMFFRYLIASAALLVILRFRPKQKIEKCDYKYIFFVGFFGYFISIGAQLSGTRLAGASVSSLINSTNPVLIMLFAALILKERLTVKKLVCVAMALLGSYVILGGGSSGHVLGIALSFVSAVVWSLSSVLARSVTQKYDPIRVTAYGVFLATAFSLPAAALELGAGGESVRFSLPAVAALLYIGVFCTGVAHLLWNKSLSMLEAGNCSLFYPLQPMTSVLLGCMFLGESVTPRFAVGALLILGGVLFSVFRREKEPPLAVEPCREQVKH